jgi:hypothetical protein
VCADDGGSLSASLETTLSHHNVFVAKKDTIDFEDRYFEVPFTIDL